jgi:hypothetical protein
MNTPPTHPETKPQTVECSQAVLLADVAVLNARGGIVTGKTLLANGLWQLTVEWPDDARRV